MRRAAWAMAAIVIAVFGGWPLSGVDGAIAQAGLFPRAAGGPGLETIVFAVLLAIAGARRGLKSWLSILVAGGLAVLGLWGTRYLVAISGPPADYIALWAWMVASEPRLHIDATSSMSSASSSTSSPTTTRSGFRRRVSSTSWRVVTSPSPSALA